MNAYQVTITENDQDVNVGNFDDLLSVRMTALSKVGRTWKFIGGLQLKPETSESFTLSADLADLFSFLSAFFAVPRTHKSAITFAQPETSETVVVLHNDPSLIRQSLEVAHMCFAQTNDILISLDVFQVTFPALFRDIDDGTDPNAAYPATILAPTVGFILAGFAAVTPDNETRAMFILTSPSGNVAQLLQGIVGADEVEEYDEDYFNYSDPNTGLSVEALDFESDHGPVIEIRFTVSETDADRLSLVIAERLQGRPEVAHLIVDEDWAEFEFQVKPVLTGGTLGPAKVIKYNL